MVTKQDHVVIYTDGGCVNNGGPGLAYAGWGVMLFYKRTVAEYRGGSCGNELTNNRAEQYAVIHALSLLSRPIIVYLYSDSKYIVNVGKGEWSANSNQDLWQEIRKYSKPHRVYWRWVKGHKNNKYNNRCDALAQEALDIVRNTHNPFQQQVKRYEEAGLEKSLPWWDLSIFQT